MKLAVVTDESPLPIGRTVDDAVVSLLLRALSVIVRRRSFPAVCPQCRGKFKTAGFDSRTPSLQTLQTSGVLDITPLSLDSGRTNSTLPPGEPFALWSRRELLDRYRCNENWERRPLFIPIGARIALPRCGAQRHRPTNANAGRCTGSLGDGYDRQCVTSENTDGQGWLGSARYRHSSSSSCEGGHLFVGRCSFQSGNACRGVR